jgi:hypothetical protein
MSKVAGAHPHTMAKESNSPRAAASGRLSQDQIQQRAYELWHQDGRPEGRDQHYWYLAERDLRESAPSTLKKMPAGPAPQAPGAFSAAAEAKTSRRSQGFRSTNTA